MNKRQIIIFILFVFYFPMLHALPSKEKDINADKGAEEKTIIIVTGIVRLVGSSAFSEIVIRGEDAQWYIAGEEKDKLHDLQYKTVTVEGEETVSELKFAGGQSAGRRRELRNIRIIEVQQ